MEADGNTPASSGTEDEAKAVAAVLSAPDHYAVLGAPRDAEVADIRRCYLRTSVRVHPDKNRHTDATTAFQRVGAAWAVLNDDRARQCYDDELRSGRAHKSSSSEGGQPGEKTTGPSMSAEDAFSAFAFATAACTSGRGGAMGDFAETLIWAQKLSQCRTNGEMPDARTLATGGLAVSAGLRTMSRAADAAGMEGLGPALDRAASVVQTASEVAAVGAVVAQIPAVREAITSGGEVAKEKIQQIGNVATAAKDFASERSSQLRTGETVAQLGATLGGVASWLGRVRERVAESHTGETPITSPLQVADHVPSNGSLPAAGQAVSVDDWLAAGQLLPLPIGAKVRLKGLNGAQHLNGRIGEVVGFDETCARLRVSIPKSDSEDGGGYPLNSVPCEAEIKKVKRENLEALP